MNKILVSSAVFYELELTGRNIVTIDESLQWDGRSQSRWLRYASAGSVALASATASGDIVLMPDLPTTLNADVNANLSVDLNGDSIDDVELFAEIYESYRFAGIAPAGGDLGNYGPTGAHNLSDPSPTGNQIMIVSNVSSCQCNNYGLSVGGSQYFGVKLSSNQYGWIHVELTTGADGSYKSLSILNGAYDNTGAAIKVGAVPEPSSFAYLGLLAAGAGAVFALKKFRRHQLIEEAKV